jgi:hypothetical protein
MFSKENADAAIKQPEPFTAAQRAQLEAVERRVRLGPLPMPDGFDMVALHLELLERVAARREGRRMAIWRCIRDRTTNLVWVSAVSLQTLIMPLTCAAHPHPHRYVDGYVDGVVHSLEGALWR